MKLIEKEENKIKTSKIFVGEDTKIGTNEIIKKRKIYSWMKLEMKKIFEKEEEEKINCGK